MYEPPTLQLMASLEDGPTSTNIHTMALLFVALMAVLAITTAITPWLLGAPWWGLAAIFPATTGLYLFTQHIGWAVLRLAQRCLPRTLMEEHMFGVMLANAETWAHMGYADVPCTARWRWKPKGLWMEVCVLVAPPPGTAWGHPRMPLRQGMALLPVRVGPFGLGNRLFAAASAFHTGILVLEWRTAHQRLANMAHLHRRARRFPELDAADGAP